MSWKGALAGGIIGAGRGGALGAMFGALMGHDLEELIRSWLRRKASAGGRSRRSPYPADGDPLAREYAILGASPNDSFETLQRKYRELAKQLHPDILRARGAGEREIARATERMSQINDAWQKIRSFRQC